MLGRAGLPADGCVRIFSSDAVRSMMRTLRARMFFDANGLREDPATGSANAAFAAYLRDKLGRSGCVGGGSGGGNCKRPSRIYLELAR